MSLGEPHGAAQGLIDEALSIVPRKDFHDGRVQDLKALPVVLKGCFPCRQFTRHGIDAFVDAMDLFLRCVGELKSVVAAGDHVESADEPVQRIAQVPSHEPAGAHVDCGDCQG